MLIQSLNGVWEARNIKNDYWLDAKVPGTILGMLVENNVADDPYYRDNEKKITELFREDYEYRRSFTVDASMLEKRRIELVCKGLDTLASIYINGTLAAKTDNMHRTWRIPVETLLHEGENEVRILFESTLEYISRRTPTPGKEIRYIPAGCREGNQYLRKAHSQFGWDWGPQLPDCGIWRDIQLEAYDVRISRMSVGQNYLEEGIEVVAYVETEGLPFDESGALAGENRYALLASMIGPDGFADSANCMITKDGVYVLKILVKEPRLWWPNGYGAHPLYEITVRLIEENKTFGGADVEQFISHKKLFDENTQDTEGSGWQPAATAFADTLGVVLSEKKSIEQDDSFGVADEDWFSDRASIGGVSGAGTDNSYFERYRNNQPGGSFDFDSDDGLFCISIDDSYGHSSDALDDARFDEEIGMGPFDNMTIGGGLFDDEPPADRPAAARPAPAAREDKNAAIRRYEKAQKSVLRSAAISVHDERSLSVPESVQSLSGQGENGEERELTAAEQMLQRMLVKKHDSARGAAKSAGAASDNYVPVVAEVSKVAHVSIFDSEEDIRKEEEALRAVAYKGGNEHKTAGQIVVSDTDATMWILDMQTKTIGLRSITISQEQDEWGEEFAFCVNGVKIFARGGNYIPQDAIYGWVTQDRIAGLVRDCIRSNFNCIRVWGGGYYPSDEFYDLCDRYGLIVWQDAMFACNIYDVTKEFEESVEAEIRDNARRLHHHACLGLWCGNNEIESAWHHWEGFRNHSSALKQDYTWLFETVLPRILNEESPMTFYWPSSPSSFGGFAYPDDENHGDCHYWDIWHGQKPLSEFLNHYFRFCSEFGFQSYPDMRTLNSFTRENDRNLFSKMMDAHQKDVSGNNKLFYYVSEQFLFPKDYESGVYLSQVMQGLAIKHCVEHMRRNRGRCMGALYWQINDCWPCISWSGIDYFGRWKAMQYMAARFYAPVAGSIQKENRVLSAWLQNETMNPVRYQVTMNLKDMEFNILDSAVSEEIIVDALSAGKLLTRDYTEISAGRSGIMYVEVEFKDMATGAVMVETEPIIPYKSLKLENPEIEVYVSEELDKYVFHLRAKKFAPFVEICLKDTDAVFGDNFFHMSRPEHQVYLYKRSFNSAGVTLEQIREQLVIKSLYDSYSYD